MSSFSEDHVRLAEALIFASADPVPTRQLAALLPEDAEADEVLRALQERCAGRGVELAEIGGGWQFRTAPDLAPRLTRVITRPRRLPRVAMETLAIIAWHQPVTRAQIEEIRGATLGQQTLDALLESGLIRTAGHREVPGRPTLWATTPHFLQQFGLKDLRELPKREELITEQPSVFGPAPGEEGRQGALPVDQAGALREGVEGTMAQDPDSGAVESGMDEPAQLEASHDDYPDAHDLPADGSDPRPVSGVVDAGHQEPEAED
jgi:segregation and condensation protein B